MDRSRFSSNCTQIENMKYQRYLETDETSPSTVNTSLVTVLPVEPKNSSLLLLTVHWYWPASLPATLRLFSYCVSCVVSVRIWLIWWALSSSIVCESPCQETVVAGPPTLRHVRLNSGGSMLISEWRAVNDTVAETSSPREPHTVHTCLLHVSDLTEGVLTRPSIPEIYVQALQVSTGVWYVTSPHSKSPSHYAVESNLSLLPCDIESGCPGRSLKHFSPLWVCPVSLTGGIAACTVSHTHQSRAILTNDSTVNEIIGASVSESHLGSSTRRLSAYIYIYIQVKKKIQKFERVL